VPETIETTTPVATSMVAPAPASDLHVSLAEQIHAGDPKRILEIDRHTAAKRCDSDRQRDRQQ